MNLYQQFIAKSRYARYLDDKQRRENWAETVARYFDFMTEHLQSRCNYTLEKELRDSLEEAVLNHKIMPSMRLMMTAGDAVKRSEIAAFNCFSGTVKVITKEYGKVELKELAGKTVNVLTKDAFWAEAFINSFGIQQTVNLKLTMNSRVVNIPVTLDHNWLLADGRLVKTRALKKGDKVEHITSPKIVECKDDYIKGLLHGVIFGDGSAIHGATRSFGYQLRLCGNSKELLEVLEPLATSINYPPSFGGDPVLFFRDKFAKSTPLKELPNQEESDSYLLGFVRGWFAADGSVQGNGQCVITSERSKLQWLQKVGPRFGISLLDNLVTCSSVTNFGNRKQDTVTGSFDRLTFGPEDCIMPSKALRYKNQTDKTYTVSEVDISSPVSEEVFCATVPGVHNFVIEQGVLTGNCSYLPIDDPKSFDELMYILLCGTGVGFSVERHYVDKLPEVPERLFYSDTIIVVKDSKEGWAKAFRQLIALLYSGEIPGWDDSKVRPEGSRLKTFGGRASGPEPLRNLFKFTVNIFKAAVGRKLTTIECHDIVCKIADIVVVGGVRRSALISLSDLQDERLRTAKSGDWWRTTSHRALSNNSAVYEERPEITQFLSEWKSLIESKSGERGIFNREASNIQAAKSGRRKECKDFGTNPCSEIILRPYQYCNLSEVIVRPEDCIESLREKVAMATILGTFQSTLTNFPYIRKIWRNNTEEECLLGVSLTGILDNHITSGKCKDFVLENILSDLRETAVNVNALFAEYLGINQSVAITCVKPSGTVSQLTDSASGIHGRHAPYYIRRVRNDNKDPLTQFMKDAGVPHEACVMNPANTTVFSFPMKSPENCVLREELTAIEHLELWLTYQRHWCEHKPSVTISVKENEWMDVGAWVYKHFDEVTGVSFLPYDGGTYQQAPYEEITKEEFEEMEALMPHSLLWDELIEKDDNVEGVQNLACSAGGCEI